MKKYIIVSALALSSCLFAQELNLNSQNLQSNQNSNVIEQSVFDESNQSTSTLLNDMNNNEEQLEMLTSMTAKEAFEKIKITKNEIILDIRSPQNVVLKGKIKSSNLIHISLENLNDYNFEKNKYFFEELKYELSIKNVPFDKEIYIIDNYSDIDAIEIGKYLNELGFTNVITISDGFEGSKAKYGKFKNRRVVNGWKNNTDSWEYSTSFSNYWTPCKYSILFEEEDKLACESKQ